MERKVYDLDSHLSPPPPPPPPRKKRHAQAHKHDEIHIDEKWLVSYSDMMTLLFGLFVMLYSIAMEKQGNMNEVLQKISKDGFQKNNDELKKLEQENKKTPVEPQTETQFVEELNKEKNVLKSELENIKKTNQKQLTENEELKLALQEMQKDKESTRLEVQNIKAQISKQNSPDSKKNSMLIIAKWTKEKHDIDMEVKTPMGKVFNFKNRNSETENSAFLVDSNKGPGAEIFKTDDNKDGIYEIKLKLYNSRGDNEPSPVELFAMTAFGDKLIEKVTLTNDKKEKTIIVNKKDYLK